jgi:3-oxoacyl-[acyl-carrier protein] reductase
MNFEIAGKTAIVTAGSLGIGKATAMSLAKEGANVAICGRNADNLAAAVKDIQTQGDVKVHTSVVDVTDAVQIERFISEVRDEFGAISILVNNAGGPKVGNYQTVDSQDWLDAYHLTLRSAVTTTELVLDDMKSAKWGRIINISSFSIKQPIPEIMLSNVMRMGVQGWAKSLSLDIGAYGITINTVCPGWTLTDRVKSMLSGADGDERQQAIIDGIPMGRFAHPDEIASMVTFLASQQASYITGAAIPVDGGVIKGSL